MSPPSQIPTLLVNLYRSYALQFAVARSLLSPLPPPPCEGIKGGGGVRRGTGDKSPYHEPKDLL